MEALKLLATLFPVALASGINLYASVLVTGICVRAGWISDPHPSLLVFASWPVMVVAGVMYAAEFFADKIPYLDSVWDFIHTFIRPLGAAALVFASLSKLDPTVAVTAALAAGGVTTVSHTAKAGGRTLINISPEPASNIAVSLVEDLFALGLVALAMRHPFIAAGVAIAVFILLLILVPRLFRWMLFTFSAILLGIKSIALKKCETEPLPAEHAALLGHASPKLSVKCKSYRVPGAGGRRGYISILPEGLAFTYSKWFWQRAWHLDLASVTAAHASRKLLVDVLEIHYKDGKGKPRSCRFIFFKDRSKLAGRIARHAGAEPIPPGMSTLSPAAGTA